MRYQRLGLFLMALLIGAGYPVLSHGAAQLKAGAKTSAKPTAPAGSSLRTIQINFDPAAPAAATTQPAPAITDFQLTVGFDGTLVSPLFADFTNTSFMQTGLVGPYSPVTPLQPGFNSFVTVSGTHDASPLLGGDVDIFSVIFQLNDGIPDDAVLPFELFASDHAGDGTGLMADIINSVDLNNGNAPQSSGPGQSTPVEPTVISAQTSGAFVTVSGNGALDPSLRQSEGVPGFYDAAVTVPLPRGVAAGLCGLVVASGFALRLRRQSVAV